MEGSYGGFQPKPAVEVILVAMKPLSERTRVDQALRNGKGVTWLDDGRIPYRPSQDRRKDAIIHAGAACGTKSPRPSSAGRRVEKQMPQDCLNGAPSARGRFPTNLLVSDDVLNDGVLRRGSSTYRVGKTYGEDHGTGYLQRKAHGVNINDSGSYSRYFDLDAWAAQLPFLIAAKPSRRERNDGVNPSKARRITSGTTDKRQAHSAEQSLARRNSHPTVKPLKLMSYLITIGSRPDDVVLDPFLGSGTTAVAARMLGRRCIGIEQDKAYLAMARARMGSSLVGA